MRKSLLLGMLLVLCVSVTRAQDHDYTGYLLANINALRAERGLPPFGYDERLSAAAFEQAEWMIEAWSYAHVHGGSTPTTRGTSAGYVDGEWCCSENTFLSPTRTPEASLRFWIRSRAHYNQLTSTWFDEIGVGYAHNEHHTGQVLVFGRRGDDVQLAAAEPATAAPTSPPAVVAAASTPVVLPPVPEVARNGQHIVNGGENLFRIGLRYGVRVDDLRAANRLSGNTIFVGQVLRVPDPSPETDDPPAAAPVQPDAPDVLPFGCNGVDDAPHELLRVASEAVGCEVMVEQGFYHVNYAALNSQELINMGVIHAVRLTGVVDPVEVCMSGGGVVMALDDALPQRLDIQPRDGFTCSTARADGLVSLTIGAIGGPGSGWEPPANPVTFASIDS